MSEPTRLYRWFDADGALLYVGISSRPAERAHEHIGTSDWTRWASRTELDPITHPTREDALRAEARAILDEEPVFNIAGARSPAARINAYLSAKGIAPRTVPVALKGMPQARTPDDEGVDDAPSMVLVRELIERCRAVIADTAAEDDPRIRLHVTARLADMLRDVANEAAWNRSRTVDLTCTSGVLTPTQIAAILGVGLARVSQLRKRAFDLAARTAAPDTEET